MENAEFNTQRILDITDEKLSSFGIPPMHLGYTYILSAVVKAVCDESVMLGITKRLYPYLAEMFNTSPQAIERNIRTAISAACKKGNDSLKAFADGESECIRITNKEFIIKTVNLIKRYS